MQIISRFIFLVFVMMMVACSADYSPKPHAYPRIIYPEKTGFSTYKNPTCPFSFEHPNYTKIVKDERFFNEKTENPCWFDIDYPMFRAKFHCSYKEIGNLSKNNLGKLLEDAHELTSKHIIKAEYIDEKLINKPEEKVHGLFMDVGGNAASSVQFYMTDSTQHFIRGALYFNSTPDYDSLRPIVDFIKADIFHFFDTFEWE